MLHLIPAPLHRRLLNVAHRLRVVWWRVAKPSITDCRVVALDQRGRVLLVRHSYGNGWWMLPGGAPNRGEDPVSTAVRELREEAGCTLTDAREVARPAPDAQPLLFVVVGRASGPARVDRREVIEARFFDPAELPQPSSGYLPARLEAWLAAYQT